MTALTFPFLPLANSEELVFLANNSDVLPSGHTINNGSGDLITYSYSDLASQVQYINNTNRSTVNSSFQELNPRLQHEFNAFLSALSNIVNLNFSEVAAGSGILRLATHSMLVGGYSTTDRGSYSYTFLNLSSSKNSPTTSTADAERTLVHEFGHALGLEHLGNYGGSEKPPYIANNIDSSSLSVMSYNSTNNSSLSFAALDIYSLVKMYGASSKTSGLNYVINDRSSSYDQSINSTTYSINLGANIVNTFNAFGTKGVDSLDLSSFDNPVSSNNGLSFDTISDNVYLNNTSSTIRYNVYTNGSFSSNTSSVNIPVISIGPSDGVNLFSIEKVILSSKSDLITLGGTTHSEIYSGAGDDTFKGFSANTLIDGGAGTDSLILNGKFKALGSTSNSVIVTDLSTNLKMTVFNFEKFSINGNSVSPNVSGTVMGQTFTNPVTVPVTVASAPGSVINGSIRDDFFTGSSKNDSIDGGLGIDTFVITGPRSNYSISREGSGYSIKNQSLGDTDILTNVERIRFSDGKIVALDIDGNAGKAYRLYQAAFDRTPDPVGLNYWISRLDVGSSLTDVSSGFVNSHEFVTLYGASPANVELVMHYYQNVLHRQPEQAGFDYWVNQLNSGLSATSILVEFSESSENQENIFPVISGGIEYMPFNTF